jgi:hypothetical protein
MTEPGRDVEVAQHEAAHVVVGVALGLRVKRAELDPPRAGWSRSGGVWFDGRAGTTEAWGLMLAAGVAWETALRGHARGASGDLAVLRHMHVHTRDRVRALSTAAAALLAGLGPEHARVTRALLERDLTGRDVEALARGERIGKDEHES